jgi:hypothetical protein
MKILIAGGNVPGWTIKESSGARQWTVPDDRVIETLGPYDIDLNELASPAEVEKRMIALGIKKKVAQEHLSGICATSKRKSLVTSNEKGQP